jgi:hypothetical protein
MAEKIADYYYNVEIKTDKNSVKKQTDFIEQQAKKVQGKLFEAFGMSKLVDIGIMALGKFFTFAMDGAKKVMSANKQMADTMASYNTQLEIAKIKIGQGLAPAMQNLMSIATGGRTSAESETELLATEKLTGTGLAERLKDKSSSQIFEMYEYAIRLEKRYRLEGEQTQRLLYDNLTLELYGILNTKIEQEKKAGKKKTADENEINRLKMLEELQKKVNKELKIQKKLEDEKSLAQETYNTNINNWSKEQTKEFEKQKKQQQESINLLTSMIPLLSDMAEKLGMSSDELDKMNNSIGIITDLLSGDVGGAITGILSGIIDIWVRTGKDIYDRVTGTNDKLWDQASALQELNRLQADLNNKASYYSSLMGLNLSDSQRQRLQTSQKSILQDQILAIENQALESKYTLANFISDPKFLTGDNFTAKEERAKAQTRLNQAIEEFFNQAERGDVTGLIGQITNYGAGSEGLIRLYEQYDTMSQLYGSEGAQEIFSILTDYVSFEESLTKTVKDGNDAYKERLGIINDIINKYSEYGLIDPENIYGQRSVMRQLEARGISGADQSEILSGLGITGIQIGSMNIEVNEASGQTLEKAISGALLQAGL